MRAARLLLPALLLPLLAAPPVGAADPPGSVEVVVTGSPDGLRARASGAALDAPFGAAAGDVGGYVVGVSRDGSRVLVDESDLGGLHTLVRDIDGTVVWQAQDFYDGYLYGVGLSPSGNRVAHYPFIDSTGTLAVTTIGSPGTTRLLPATSAVAFLSEDRLLVNNPVTRGSLIRRFTSVSLSGGPTLPVTGLADGETQDLVGFSISPQADRIAYRRRVAATGTSTLEVAPLTVTARGLAVGRPTVLAPAPGIAHPTWTRDGRSLVLPVGERGSGDLVAVPVDGGPVVPFGPATPERDETSVAVGVRDASPPTAAVPFVSALLDGTRATLRLGARTDPTVSRLRVTRTSPGLPTVTREVVLPATSFSDTDLVVGARYTYLAEVVDRSGNVGPNALLRLDATERPTLLTQDPTSNTSAYSPFPAKVVDSNAALSTRYSIDYRPAGRASWTRWVTRGVRGTYHVGLTGYAAVAPSSSVPGTTYEFRMQAFDAFGNATGVVLPPRAVVPHDQQRASYGGSVVTVKREGAYGGATAFLRAAGARADLRFSGDRVQVIGERCPTCGEVDVFLDGRRVVRVDTRAATRSVRQVLWSRGFVTGQPRTLTLRAVGTAGRPTVVLDAYAVRAYRPPAGASLAAGEQLLKGQSLVSLDKRWRAEVGAYGGALQVRNPDGVVAFHTKGGGDRLVMQKDGNLVLYDDAGKGVFQTGTGGQGLSSLVLQTDGNLVVYRDRDGRPLWSSRSGRTY